MNTAINPNTAVTVEQSQDITVRKMDLDYTKETPDFWYDNDPLLTMYLVAFSATLPEGEKSFIRSVRHYQKQITDPKLKEDIQNFIGQEAHHAKEHVALNKFFDERGYPTKPIENRLKKFLSWTHKQSPEFQLAHTVCAEHITALLSNYYMSYAPEELEKMSPEIRKIWAWHIVEESEHKAVAFDVYQTVVNDKNRLRFHMVWLTALFVIDTAFSTIALLAHSKQLNNGKMWTKAFRYFLGKKSLLRNCWREYLDFYRKDFHPWQHDVKARLQEFKAQYDIR